MTAQPFATMTIIYRCVRAGCGWGGLDPVEDRAEIVPQFRCRKCGGWVGATATTGPEES